MTIPDSRQGGIWPDIASDEDMTTGFMLATESVPDDPDLRLGLFLVLTRREWDHVYDPAKLTISDEPRGFKWAGDDLDEDYSVPVEGDEEATAGRWFVIAGLDDAEMR